MGQNSSADWVGMPLCVHWTLDMRTCRMSNFCWSIADMEGLFKSVDGYVSKPLLYYAFDNANFEVAELLVEYGIDMTKQDWRLTREHLPKGLRGDDYVYNNLLVLYRNPADLKVLVRSNLRQLLGRSIRVASTQSSGELYYL